MILMVNFKTLIFPEIYEFILPKLEQPMFIL